MIQKTVPVGRLRCNCQILVCERTREAVLVDPGDEPGAILKELESIEGRLGAKLQVRALLHTHAHFDHIGATRAVKEALASRTRVESGAAPEIFLHQADEFLYKMLPEQSAMFGFQNSSPLPVDRYVEDEQTLQFGSLRFTVLHTPGHSPGGVCFRLHEDSAAGVSETVFTGDTLFQESIGRSDLWGGDGEQLVRSIRQRLFTLDDDTRAWPGHGSETSIGHEKRSNPYLG